MTTVLAVAATSLRELSRRGVALLFVFGLPLAFYLVRLDVHWQAIRMLSLGVGWAIATLALFSHVAARPLDRRLSVIGASPTALFVGRQLALVAVGLGVAGVYFVLVTTTLTVPRPSVIGLLLVTSVLIAAPLGAVVSLVVPRELEGALALLSIMALQLLVDPADAASRVLPLWSTRELSAYAIEAVDAGYLHRGLLHFALTTLVCVLIAWTASILRLRPVELPVPTD